MSRLTREQAIAEHRKMWNWIADETLRKERCITKVDYFNTFRDEYEDYIASRCWCCEYVIQENGVRYCSKCIVDWPQLNDDKNRYSCKCNNSLYGLWYDVWYYDDYEKAAEIARQIANLPESKNIK